MAKEIISDLKLPRLAGTGTRSLAVDATGNVVDGSAAGLAEGVLLTTVDMTNGGANDLNNIDVTWQASWDNYDYVKILINNATATNNGQFGFALSSDAGSTWESFYSVSREVCSPVDTSFTAGDSFSFVAEMALRERVKPLHFWNFTFSPNAGAAEPNISNNVSYLGTLFNYSGTTLTNALGVGTSVGWDTGGDGLNGYMLRFAHEVGNFNTGTLKIIGYNYP